MDLAQFTLGRRRYLQTIAALGATASLAGCADAIPQDVGLNLAPSPITDPAVLNFALNLEYLEAEYYLRATTGDGVPAGDTGPRPGAVAGGRRVAFTTPDFQSFAEEIAADELAHVRFLRQGIDGSPLGEISRPAIDLQNSFRAAGQAAGLGPSFDPFADEISFLLGAFLFEDVGVNAYKAAAKLISDKNILQSAAGILAVEGYHAGLIRTQLLMTGRQDAISAANAISNARAQLGGDVDQGLTLAGQANAVMADDNGIAFGRAPETVLKIVYLNPQSGVKGGGFFPNGVNGVVDYTRTRPARPAARPS